MMIPTSIRWRLPLSYAVIALLAALSLGLVLIPTLRTYYRERELAYLERNASEFSIVMATTRLTTETLQSQVAGLAFLAQARVRLLDANEQALADSGVPTRTAVTVGSLALVAPISDTLVGAPPDALGPGVVTVIGIGGAPPPVGENIASFAKLVTQSVEFSPGITRPIEPAVSVSFVGTAFGLDAIAEQAADGVRSDQVMRQPILDTAGQTLGYVELSEGPAYGREIVDSVAQGWVLASGVGVILAASVGWLASRRLSEPLLALNEVTMRMAGGDLAPRASVTRRDEIGTLARSFNEMADRVEEIVNALRRFVADAAHELNTPLTALRTDLELATGAGSDAARRDQLDRAQQQVRRLQMLADGLLDLSRIEAGAAQTEYERLNLVELVRAASEPFASRAEQSGIGFSLDLPRELVTVRGDHEQLRRAIDNLLDNAIKFTAASGSVRVAVRQEDAQAVVSVEDTGIGIPDDEVAQLFRRFHRGRNASEYPGSGLGLVIVKAIVDRHGGEVFAANSAHGARFTIRLPAA